MEISHLISNTYEQEIDTEEDYHNQLQWDRNMRLSLFGLHSPELSVIENLSNYGCQIDHNFSHYDNSGTKDSEIVVCKSNKKIRKRKQKKSGLLSKSEFINSLQKLEQCQSIQFFLDQLSHSVKTIKDHLCKKIAQVSDK
ncbi:unnamed protein product (macronuclear) [Paramecium tetraurelia]|uniref:Uncharacterized protein n=1 Tax=Paramecium tetraurelia TaxID=5888 RepID=A0E5P1_PARTE|nr:uncharacterized protein GSPATT00003470001 [Paramecium tetraurelia]CAK90608.1 unnamed protein product [Paramecium tetraurelia]|eukprot:XP_001458005.1 hypothetical protein (macronuclear) [Paramecium tetraurelia strain d4-2]